MSKEAETIIAVLVAVIVLALFFTTHPNVFRGAVTTSLVWIAYIVIIYRCVQLNQRYLNPYFELVAISYGLELAVPVAFTLATLAGRHLSLSLGDAVPTYVSFTWFTAIELFLVTYATLLYREEKDEGLPAMERLFVLAPTAKTRGFWLVVAGLPLIYNTAYQIVDFHFQGISFGIPLSYAVPHGGYLPIPKGIISIVTNTVIMTIMLLNIIFNLALFRIYQRKFFRYLYVISLVAFVYSVLLKIYSLISFDWLFRPGRPVQNNPHLLALFMNPHTGITVIAIIVEGAYEVAMAVFTVVVFFTYGESPRKHALPTRPVS